MRSLSAVMLSLDAGGSPHKSTKIAKTSLICIHQEASIQMTMQEQISNFDTFCNLFFFYSCPSLVTT